MRPSILVQKNGKNLLIDTSPDLKQQFLDNKINNIDAVLYTHEHADHTHGINELRSINLINKNIIPCYGNEETMRKILNSFNWEPSLALKDGLKETYKWIENQIKSGENTQKFTKTY